LYRDVFFFFLFIHAISAFSDANKNMADTGDDTLFRDFAPDADQWPMPGTISKWARAQNPTDRTKTVWVDAQGRKWGFMHMNDGEDDQQETWYIHLPTYTMDNYVDYPAADEDVVLVRMADTFIKYPAPGDPPQRWQRRVVRVLHHTALTRLKRLQRTASVHVLLISGPDEKRNQPVSFERDDVQVFLK